MLGSIIDSFPVKRACDAFFALIALYVKGLYWLQTQYCEKAYDDLHMCNQYISNVFISIFVLYLDISVRKK